MFISLRRNNRLLFEFLLAIIIISFFFRILILFRPMDQLVSYILDDAFYYFEIAKNFVEGNGIQFNGGVPTNGFHPLYLFILIPIYQLFLPFGVDIPIYITLFILTLFHLGTGITIFSILKNIQGELAGLIGSFFWLLNPYIMIMPIMGLETNIQIFFISLLVLLLVKSKMKFNLLISIKISILLSLIVLSRLDGILYIGSLLLAIFLNKTRELWKKKEKTLISFIKNYINSNTIIIFSLPVITLASWVFWSYITTGYLLPVSGSASRYQRLKYNTFLEIMYLLVWDIGSKLIDLFYYSAGDYLIQIAVFITIYLIPICLFLVISIKNKDFQFFHFLRKMDFLVISLAIFFIYYLFIQLWIRPWYWLFPFFSLCILGTMLIIYLTKLVQKHYNLRWKFENIKKALFWILLGMLALNFLYNGFEVGKNPPKDSHRLKIEIAKYLDNNIESNETIGAFNAGAFQYFTKNHDIVNLDGVVNQYSHEALISNTFQQYILNNNITYIVDDPHFVRWLNGSLLELNVVKIFNITYFESNLYLYIYLFKINSI